MMIFVTTVFIALLVTILVLYLYKIRASCGLRAVAIAGFGVRALFVLVDNKLRVFAGSGDASSYEATLWFVAEQWRSEILAAPLHVFAGPGHAGYYEVLYSAVLAPIYLLFGRSPILIRLAMALIGAIVVVNVYRLARELGDHRAGLYAAGITAVFPYWIQLSGILYRDMLLILLLTWTTLFLVRWQDRNRGYVLVLSLFAAGLALSLRLINIAPVGAMIGVTIYMKFETSIRQKAYTIVAISVMGVGFLAKFRNQITVSELANRRLWLARPKPASYFTGVAYGNIVELIMFAPVGIFYFVLVPFPWQTVNTLAIIAIVQNLLIWYPIILFAILGVRNAINEPSGTAKVTPLVTFAFAGIFSYGLVEGNIGPAMRHRSQFQFIFFTLAGIGLSEPSG
jgi:4-amino-4-deoxy-L-arabinose transferase-like glycosyltransferase